MDNPKKLAELIALKVKYISRKADFDLSRAVVDEICKVDHYGKNSLIKHPKAIYDSLEGLFAEILEAGTNLTYPTTKFNKQGKLVAALSSKDLVLIITPELYNKMVEKNDIKTSNLSYEKSLLKKKIAQEIKELNTLLDQAVIEILEEKHEIERLSHLSPKKIIE